VHLDAQLSLRRDNPRPGLLFSFGQQQGSRA
jgi:hypothetical protein